MHSDQLFIDQWSSYLYEPTIIHNSLIHVYANNANANANKYGKVLPKHLNAYFNMVSISSRWLLGRDGCSGLCPPHLKFLIYVLIIKKKMITINPHCTKAIVANIIFPTFPQLIWSFLHQNLKLICSSIPYDFSSKVTPRLEIIITASTFISSTRKAFSCIWTGSPSAANSNRLVSGNLLAFHKRQGRKPSPVSCHCT